MVEKAIYTKIKDKFYRVKQSVTNPSTVFRMPETHTQMAIDKDNKYIHSGVWINAINIDTIKTNKENYDDMILYFTNNIITKLPTIHNHFVMYCDYSIYDENDREINHNVSTKEIDPFDAIYPLGVGEDCELIYKQIKAIETDMEFTVKNKYPFGITHDISKTKYVMVINDISIYQDIAYDSSIHNSENGNTYSYGSHTIESRMKNMEKVYSTFDNGIIISAVEVPFTPKKIIIKFKIALDSNIVVYDDAKISSIIEENIALKRVDFSKNSVVANGERYPTTNGDGEYDVNGSYDKYVLVEDECTDEHTMVVVEDDEPNYNNMTMIHKSLVIADIPEIQIGQKVKYTKIYRV